MQPSIESATKVISQFADPYAARYLNWHGFDLESAAMGGDCIFRRRFSKAAITCDPEPLPPKFPIVVG